MRVVSLPRGGSEVVQCSGTEISEDDGGKFVDYAWFVRGRARRLVANLIKDGRERYHWSDETVCSQRSARIRSNDCTKHWSSLARGIPKCAATEILFSTDSGALKHISSCKECSAEGSCTECPVGGLHAPSARLLPNWDSGQGTAEARFLSRGILEHSKKLLVLWEIYEAHASTCNSHLPHGAMIHEAFCTESSLTLHEPSLQALRDPPVQVPEAADLHTWRHACATRRVPYLRPDCPTHTCNACACV